MNILNKIIKELLNLLKKKEKTSNYPNLEKRRKEFVSKISEKKRGK